MTLTQLLETIRAHTGREPRASNGGYKCHCPAHEDREPSLSVSEAPDGKLLVKCHAGCTAQEIMAAQGLAVKDLYPADKPRKSGQGKIVATYDYTDADGKLVFQVVRFRPKGFRQRRPDGNGGWIWNLKGLRAKPLYQLPQVLEGIKQGRTVFLVEGEKDADNLLARGLCATTNAAGAAKWNREYTAALSKAGTVAIFPDNDEPGRKHAHLVRSQLPNAVVVELPDLPPKGDVSDWLAQGGTAEELHKLVEAAKAAPRPAEPEPAETRPVFSNFHETDGGRVGLNMPDLAARLDGLTEGWPRRVGKLLFVEREGQVEYLDTTERLFAWIGAQADIRWAGGVGIGTSSLCEKPLFRAHLEQYRPAFKAAEELPHCPEIPGVYYAWRPNPHYEPNGDVLDELVGFFDNVETPADRALVMAAFCTPAWGGLPGQRPAFAILAVDRGCGKSTLADAVAALYGGAIAVEPSARGEDKLLERLLAPNSLARRVIVLDNLKSAKGSGLIEGLITAREVSGHRMYCGEAQRPNFLTWILTGNTMRLSRDLAERSFVIRLKRPDAFKPAWREQLMGFIDDNREDILADVLRVLRNDPAPHVNCDRWAAWNDGVLARCTTDVDAVLKLTGARRAEMDTDLEEAETILEALKEALRETGDSFVSSTAALEKVNRALGVNWTARRLKQVIDGHIEADRLIGVKHSRKSAAKGYLVK